jgi:hypothetical protein|tara:strand:+ start:61 stop:228 length:168 start_codon:yes stop_codon:yes gene_type:complete
MPSKTQKPKKERDENGRYVKQEEAVVSRIGEYEENPTPAKSGDVKTPHGNTITYS